MAPVMKAKRVTKATRKVPGKLAKASAQNAKSPKNKKQLNKGSKPTDEKVVAKQRAAEVNALSLADLEKLHQSNAIGSEPVNVVLARIRETFAAKQIPDLKALCEKANMKVGGAKTELVERLVDKEKEILRCDMVKSALAFEAKARADARAHEAKVRDVVSKMRKDFALKTNQELKDMCVSRGIKPGASKKERMDRLVSRAREDGEVEKVLAGMARDERRNELLSMDDQALMNLCTTRGVNPLVKAIMVDRLLLSESA